MSWSSKKPSNFIGKCPSSRPRSQIVKATYEQSVLLTDWWLIEVESNSEGRRLGVAGYPSRGRQAMRHFKSTAILKRHDAVTLETEDGMTITITSGINMFKSLESGFPREVCNCFLFGFPYYWKELADKCVGKESTNKTGWASSVNGIDTFPDDLPVAHVRDILMLSSGDSARYLIGKCICSHIPRKQGDNAFKDDVNCAKTEGKRKRQEDDTNDTGGTVAGDLSGDATPKTRNESNVEKHKDKCGVLCSTDSRKQGGYAVNDNEELSFTKTNGKRKIKEDDTNDGRLDAGYLSDDATPETQKASKVKKGSKNRSGILRSTDPKNQGNTACNDGQNCANTKRKHKRQKDTNGSSQLMAGDVSDDATLMTRIASNVEKKSKDEGLCSADSEKVNAHNVETLRGTSIDENLSRRTTRSMRRLNNVGTKGGQI